MRTRSTCDRASEAARQGGDGDACAGGGPQAHGQPLGFVGTTWTQAIRPPPPGEIAQSHQQRPYYEDFLEFSAWNAHVF
jgi:hypothetical protein